MERVHQIASFRKKRAVSKISLIHLWGPQHNDAFATIKQQLAAVTKLAHSRKDPELCLFTDASETHWAAVLTLVSRKYRKRPIDQQIHRPLCFLSGALKVRHRIGLYPRRKGLPWLNLFVARTTWSQGLTVAIFTDHANLVYLFDPYGRTPGLPRYTASKLIRWAIKLSAFSVCHRIFAEGTKCLGRYAHQMGSTEPNLKQKIRRN